MSVRNKFWEIGKRHKPKKIAKDSKIDVEVRFTKTSILDIKYGAGILVRVRLRAKFDPTLIAQSEKHFPTSESFSRMRKATEAMGGTLAEYLAYKYSDELDPSEVAWQTVQVFDKLVKQYEQNPGLTSAKLVY